MKTSLFLIIVLVCLSFTALANTNNNFEEFKSTYTYEGNIDPEVFFSYPAVTYTPIGDTQVYLELVKTDATPSEVIVIADVIDNTTYILVYAYLDKDLNPRCFDFTNTGYIERVLSTEYKLSFRNELLRIRNENF